MQILLSRTQAGPGRTVKQEQEEISRNHVQTFFGGSVLGKRRHAIISNRGARGLACDGRDPGGQGSKHFDSKLFNGIW